MQQLTRLGFTLIELSIVLVIIGLLVGGVLTGQNLIKAAEARAEISQVEKYNTAVNTFEGKYGALPGDMNVATATQFGFVTTGCNGSQGHRDGNGLIDGWSSPYIYDQTIGETGVFWGDLSQAGLIDGTYPNSGAVINGCSPGATPITSATAGKYFPPAKIGGGNFLYVYEIGGFNWYGLSAVVSASGANSLYSNPGLSVIQAYNIDKKIDDGFPTTGDVQATYINGADGNVPPIIAPNAGADSASTCYNTGGSTPAYSIGYQNGAGVNCALSFRFQ